MSQILDSGGSYGSQETRVDRRVMEEALDALVAGVRTQAEFDVVFRGLKCKKCCA